MRMHKLQESEDQLVIPIAPKTEQLKLEINTPLDFVLKPLLL